MGKMKFLSDKDPGESVVRPSSRGLSFLTLTLKIYEGVYANEDIIEGEKEHKDITSLLQIGKTLNIGEDTFEDLDEGMLNYHKFRKGTKTEVDEFLRIEKVENPMRIVYCFGISHEHPGTIILTYIRERCDRRDDGDQNRPPRPYGGCGGPEGSYGGDRGGDRKDRTHTKTVRQTKI
ncbi:hypothetical protein BUALT_Bualt16G0109200 [Buddleja alternifolia]|uniref:Spt6 SH2 domain-containing protein n=1 Tax=Buddleja alternifolia TaxID=168488 RepID=A0AAV6WC76_9LAMI|nr:hypothetical protein BUALT_Bualt16G0109200 [Buddleja alternifolia]